MRKNYYLVTLFVLLFAFSFKVSASTCKNERVMELTSLANNVNVSYQEYEQLVDEYDSEMFADEEDSHIKVTYPSYYLTVYNLVDDLNVSVSRNDTNQVIIATSKDKDEDGVVYFDTGFATRVKTFTVKIRSNDSNCQNEVLKTLTLTTPMFNKMSLYHDCEENPEFSLCQKFTSVDYSNVTPQDFDKKLSEYKVQKEEEEKKANSIWYNIGNFLSKYMWFIIIPIVVIVIAIIVIYVIRRKKSRLV